MILIVGATGMVGGATARMLREAGRPVRALVRPTSDAAKVEALRAIGCEVAVGSVHDAASLHAACRGAESLVTTISAMPFSWVPPVNTIDTVDRDGQIRLFDAAKAAGVGHIVHVTFSGNLDRDFALRNAKRAAEAHLKASGVPYTILRPSCFMEIWLGPAVGFDYANRHAAIYGNGHQPISWISFLDVAKFAVASLDHPAARNATIELGGPEALSPLQVVTIFEEEGGKPFDTVFVPVPALEQQRDAAPDEMQRTFSELMLCVAGGDPIPMEETLRTFPIPMVTVREYARSVIGAAQSVGA